MSILAIFRPILFVTSLDNNLTHVMRAADNCSTKRSRDTETIVSNIGSRLLYTEL
jgi:hypothetical protein